VRSLRIQIRQKVRDPSRSGSGSGFATLLDVAFNFQVKKAVAELKNKKKLLEDRELELRPSHTKVSPTHFTASVKYRCLSVVTTFVLRYGSEGRKIGTVSVSDLA